MSFYRDMANTATELLTEFGATCTLNRETKAYDPASGATTSSTQSWTGQAVVLSFTAQESSINDEIRTTDKKILLSPQLSPMSNDYVEVAGTRYRALSVRTENPTGSLPVIHEIHGRKDG